MNFIKTKIIFRNCTFICLACIYLLASCNQKETTIDHEDGLAAFSADSLRQHVSVLSSDSFMGRKPFTPGQQLTLDYLQAQFASAGLEPANGNSFLQEVPMVNILATAAPSMDVETPKGKMTLKA